MKALPIIFTLLLSADLFAASNCRSAYNIQFSADSLIKSITQFFELKGPENKSYFTNVYGNTLLGEARNLQIFVGKYLSFSIQGTHYYHSFLFGNHPTTYARFQIDAENTRILEKRETDNFFFLKIEVSYSKEKEIQTLTIDKRSSPIRVKISKQHFQGLWKTDLWPESTTIYLDHLEFHESALKHRQSSGL